MPALKQPLVPVVDHRLDKSRKSRGPRAPKLADQVTNGWKKMYRMLKSYQVWYEVGLITDCKQLIYIFLYIE